MSTLKFEDVKALVDLVSERNIAELELEEAGVKLKIRKAIYGSHAPATSVVIGSDEASTASESTKTSAEPASSTRDGLAYVLSPMVGTFYRQPEPGADPFAREGDHISKGQVLCIIEAMKLMNEIESEYHGELVQVLAENGQAVQFGDRLFAIREM
ncbi:MAG TPA: acetyl-CoA carboxylase biotin carboxyl carrier protein [Vicinamibacteria bacterium]|nr:acetyl-CoA carboxylase biotin carboxyl carrier protein [Vicinamibacteria bacterium]